MNTAKGLAMKGESDRSIERRLLDAFRIHQQRARFVGKAYDTELSLVEALLLTEIDTDPTLSAQDLVPILHVDKSNVSRLLKKLSDLGFLEASLNSHDKRKKTLRLSKIARDFLRQREKVVAESMSFFLKNLNDSEQRELAGYLKQLADGDNAPVLKFNPTEHPIFIETRRLARCLDAYGNSWLGSEEDNLTFHLLSEIAYHPFKRKIADIATLLGVPVNSMSQILSRLEHRGLLERSLDDSDARIRQLSLTTAGYDLLEHIEKCAEYRFRKATPGIPPAEWKRFVELMSRYVGEAYQEGESFTLENSTVVKEILSEEERQHCRIFLINELVRVKKQGDISETILSAQNRSFGLYNNSKLVAVIETKINAEEVIEILHFALSAPAEKHAQERAAEKRFLEFVLNKAHHQVKGVTARIGSWAGEMLTHLGGKHSGSNDIRLVINT